jgi:hypothetical protein
MRLSSVGFSEVLRDFAPEPAPGVLPVLPRFPRNCCASASFFFFSRAPCRKFANEADSAMAVESDRNGRGGERLWMDVRRLARNLGQLARQAGARMPEISAPGPRKVMPLNREFLPMVLHNTTSSKGKSHSCFSSPLYHDEPSCRPYHTSIW